MAAAASPRLVCTEHPRSIRRRDPLPPRGRRACSPRILSWSTAAGRYTSAATSSGDRPSSACNRRASFAAAVVLPAPWSPQSSTTVGAPPSRYLRCDARLHGISTWHPRRGRDLYNIHVAPAASPQLVSTEYPRRGRGGAATRLPNVHAAKVRELRANPLLALASFQERRVVAAHDLRARAPVERSRVSPAVTRPASSDDPRGSRGVAATRRRPPPGPRTRLSSS